MENTFEPVLGPEAYTDDWYQARRKTIGASEASAVLGWSKYKQPLDVYNSKLNPDGGQGGVMSEAMQRGKDFEAVCLLKYGRRVGGTVYHDVPMLIHPDHKFMSSTPDALWCEGSVNFDKLPWSYSLDYIPVEAKTTEVEREYGNEGTSEIPACYIIQSQQHMAVTGKKRCDVPVLMGFRLKLYVVERNQDIIEALLLAEKEIIERVENNDPPEINWEHPKTLELVTSLYDVTNETLMLSEENCERWLEVEKIKEQRRGLDERERSLKALIQGEMENCGVGRMMDGREIVRSKQKRGAYEVAACEFVTLRCRNQK